MWRGWQGGQTLGRGKALAGPSCLAPSGREQHDAHFGDEDLMDSVAALLSCTYSVLSHLA